MDTMEAIRERHSVRQFTDKPLEADAVAALKSETEKVNQESGMHIQLITNEMEAFDAGKPNYGSFQGCRNYFAVIGPKGKAEEAGYYGQRLVIKAQELGINSCWVAMTYKKGKAKGDVGPGEKRYIVIALGYGKTQGAAHKNKPITEVSDFRAGDPDWYKNGLDAALLAPTAMNQQKFYFTRNGDKVTAKAGFGFYTDIDLGIVKYNFEVGAGKGKEVWG
ncbi:MAG: nitroreductase family protein [Lachnospiraceae bacterium]|jgi:hypothetical protein